MENYRYGELLISNRETILETAISGEKVTIPKGNPVVIGFDGLAHHIRTGRIQPFNEGTRIRGFTSTGLIRVIMETLEDQYPMDEMLSDYDITKEDFEDTIECALEEIGLYKN